MYVYNSCMLGDYGPMKIIIYHMPWLPSRNKAFTYLLTYNVYSHDINTYAYVHQSELKHMHCTVLHTQAHHIHTHDIHIYIHKHTQAHTNTHKHIPHTPYTHAHTDTPNTHTCTHAHIGAIEVLQLLLLYAFGSFTNPIISSIPRKAWISKEPTTAQLANSTIPFSLAHSEAIIAQ